MTYIVKDTREGVKAYYLDYSEEGAIPMHVMTEDLEKAKRFKNKKEAKKVSKLRDFFDIVKYSEESAKGSEEVYPE